MARKINIAYYKKLLWQNLPKALLYPLILFLLPLVSFIFYNKSITSISTLYQVIGIFLLYYEEKFKMDHSTRKYGKLNTWLMFILKSWGTIKHSIREIYRLKTNFYKKDCDIKIQFSVTKINHDYHKIEDKEERLKQQLISIESDIGHLRYFSEVRKTGYILIAIGYILQFLLSLCPMVSFCFCSVS